MAASVFSSGDDAITRKIECTPTATKTDELRDVYEIEKCRAWITAGKFKMVALQFPDELLVDAPAVAGQIQEQINEITVFILGDTSYGSCCVDEVGAQHYKADCIIHFGRACLSPTARLPVLYVFGRSEIDVEDCVHQVTEICSDTDMKTVLVYDTAYLHAIDGVFLRLQQTFKQMVMSKLSVPSHIISTSTDRPAESLSCGASCSEVPSDNNLPLRQGHYESQTSEPSVPLSSEPSACMIAKCGRTIELSDGESPDTYTFLFVGDPSGPTLTNLMMTFNKCPFYTYDPMKRICQRETLNVNKALMKRYYLIERAKDANIVGIVAGTLGVAKYRDMIEHLKGLLKKAGKKSYTFVVGKLNPAKLGNFAEVDIFVLVACPESSMLDQSEFYRPVVSPFEMEIACNQAREWTGDYSTDFQELLPGASMHIQTPDSWDDDKETADVSLISNRVRMMGMKDVPEVSDLPGQDLVLRSEAMAVTAVAENAGEFLANRSWKGLEQKLGETPVTKAMEGQHGIAASYQHEPS